MWWIGCRIWVPKAISETDVQDKLIEHKHYIGSTARTCRKSRLEVERSGRDAIALIQTARTLSPTARAAGDG